MSEFWEPMSRNEAILQNILGAENELADPQSEIETILMAILEGDTTLEILPTCSTSEMLLAILNSEAYTKEPTSRNEVILKAKIDGEVFEGEVYSRIEYLLALWTADPADWQLAHFPIAINLGKPVAFSQIIGG